MISVHPLTLQKELNKSKDKISSYSIQQSICRLARNLTSQKGFFNPGLLKDQEQLEANILIFAYTASIQATVSLIYLKDIQEWTQRHSIITWKGKFVTKRKVA